MKKLYDEIKKVLDMYNSQTKRKEFNEEMVRKTWEYQKKFGFETSPRQGHEFWNNEADAFKHAFGSADMALDMGQLGSIIGGIYHEKQTKNNPYGEWNMDSWNNNEGRKIAEEIKKEYGKNFAKLSDKEKDAIIAAKVMMKMRNGELIKHPSDNRKFKGFFENLIYKQSALTGGATPITDVFTADQIGDMTSEEFMQNEPEIMQQLKDGLIKSETPEVDYSGYLNPVSGNSKIFSREAISQMTGDEYLANEPEIMAQLQSIGVPTESELHTASLKGGTIYVRPYTRSDGTEVRGYYRAV